MVRRILLGLAMLVVDLLGCVLVILALIVVDLLGCVVVIVASVAAVFATLWRAWRDRRVFEREREQGSK